MARAPRGLAHHEPLITDRPLVKVSWSQMMKDETQETYPLRPRQDPWGYGVVLGDWEQPLGRGTRTWDVRVQYADIPDLITYLTTALADWNAHIKEGMRHRVEAKDAELARLRARVPRDLAS